MRSNAQTNMGWHRATSQGRNSYEEPERAKDPLGGPLKGCPFLTETHIGIAKKRPPLDHHRSTSSFLLTSRLASEKQDTRQEKSLAVTVERRVILSMDRVCGRDAECFRETTLLASN